MGSRLSTRCVTCPRRARSQCSGSNSTSRARARPGSLRQCRSRTPRALTKWAVPARASAAAPAEGARGAHREPGSTRRDVSEEDQGAQGSTLPEARTREASVPAPSPGPSEPRSLPFRSSPEGITLQASYGRGPGATFRTGATKRARPWPTPRPHPRTAPDPGRSCQTPGSPPACATWPPWGSTRATRSAAGRWPPNASLGRPRPRTRCPTWSGPRPKLRGWSIVAGWRSVGSSP